MNSQYTLPRALAEGISANIMWSSGLSQFFEVNVSLNTHDILFVYVYYMDCMEVSSFVFFSSAEFSTCFTLPFSCAMYHHLMHGDSLDVQSMLNCFFNCNLMQHLCLE